MFQSEGESVTDFVVRLKPISPDCKFSCPGCHKDLQPIHTKDQLILGLYNEKLQTDILAEVSHLIQLEDMIKHYEAYESAQRNQWPLHKSTSLYCTYITISTMKILSNSTISKTGQQIQINQTLFWLWKSEP